MCSVTQAGAMNQSQGQGGPKPSWLSCHRDGWVVTSKKSALAWPKGELVLNILLENTLLVVLYSLFVVVEPKTSG